MKKIFTLIAMALMAVGVNAKTQIDFSQKWQAGVKTDFGSWEYVGIRLADSEPAKNTEAGTADDSQVKYFDASAYDYLCIKYRETSAAFRFILQYNCKGTIGQWGTEFNEVMETLSSTTSGVVGIKLDADKKNTIFQFALQSEGTGSIIIDEIYWASEAEYTTDVTNNPVVKAVPPTKDLNLASATGGWGDPEYNAETHKTVLSKGGAAGWWVGGDLSDYDYLVFEVENLTVGDWAQFSVFGQGVALFKNSGSFIQVIDISNMKRDLTDTSVYQNSGTNIVLQGNAGTTWTWKQAYFATADYIAQNNIKSQIVYGDKHEFGLAGLGVWEIEGEKVGTFDATTGVLSFTAENGGGAGWWQGSADFSHFDNFVVELESSTANGIVFVEYNAEAATAPRRANAQTSVTFGEGATCVVVPLDEVNKADVRNVCIQGDKGTSYTIKKAYMAVESATPEANIGTVTAISSVKAAAQQNGVRYNLAGQKVNGAYKGVVIENGKKVVMK